MQLRGEVTPHIGRHAFAVLAILKGMLLETLQKVFGHKSITYVLRIHSLVRRRRGNLFLEVAHLYDQRADQLSQLLIRACFNNCQFHTKILFKILNMRQSNAHPIYPFQTDNIRVFRWRALAYPTLKEKVLHLHPCGNGTSIPLLVFHKFIGLISGA